MIPLASIHAFLAPLALAASWQASAERPNPRIAVKAARIVVAPGKSIPRGVMIIENGKVAAVGADLGIPKNAVLKDYSKDWVYPGFVDIHSDAGGFGDITDTTVAFTPGLRAIDAYRANDLALQRAAAAGITTSALSPDGSNVVAGVGAVLKTAGDDSVVKPEAFLKCSLAEAALRDDRYPTSSATAIGKLFEMLKEPRAPWLALMPRDQVVLGRAAKDLRPMIEIDQLSTLRRTLALAKELKLRPAVVARGDFSEAAQELAAAKVPVVLPQLTFASTPNHRRQVETYLKAGAEIFFANLDSTRSETPVDLRVAAALAMPLGMSSDAALRMVTSGPAAFLGIEGRTGTLEVGRDADFIVSSGDLFHLTSSIRAVAVGGEFVRMEAR